MSELAQAEVKTESPEELFYRLMEQMPANMTLYDELQNRRNNLWAMRKSHGRLVDGIDINLPPESHPEEVAYGALGLYLADRKIIELEKQMQDLDYAGDWLKFLDLRGRKVRVEPLGDTWKIATIAPGHNYISSTKRAKTGTLSRLALTPSDGGRLEFKTRFSGDTHRTADPIFDHIFKEPQFKIELLD